MESCVFGAAAFNDFGNLGSQLVRVMTGNAGGLEISLNGKALEPLDRWTGTNRQADAEGLLPDGKAQSLSRLSA